MARLGLVCEAYHKKASCSNKQSLKPVGLIVINLVKLINVYASFTNQVQQTRIIVPNYRPTHCIHARLELLITDAFCIVNIKHCAVQKPVLRLNLGTHCEIAQNLKPTM